MTVLAGVLGHPVAHSRSPAMFNAAFAALGLDWHYVKLPVPPELFDRTVRALPGSGYRGANVTIPHKLAALALSSLLAGLAGATFAYYHVSYYPELPFSPQWTFDAVLITFVGGVGTLLGPLVGAAFYILVREVLAVSLVQVHQVLFGALFIAVVLLLPGGLVSAVERLRVKRKG